MLRLVLCGFKNNLVMGDYYQQEGILDYDVDGYSNQELLEFLIEKIKNENLDMCTYYLGTLHVDVFNLVGVLIGKKLISEHNVTVKLYDKASDGVLEVILAFYTDDGFLYGHPYNFFDTDWSILDDKRANSLTRLIFLENLNHKIII